MLCCLLVFCAVEFSVVLWCRVYWWVELLSLLVGSTVEFASGLLTEFTVG